MIYLNNKGDSKREICFDSDGKVGPNIWKRRRNDYYNNKESHLDNDIDGGDEGKDDEKETANYEYEGEEREQGQYEEAHRDDKEEEKQILCSSPPRHTKHQELIKQGKHAKVTWANKCKWRGMCTLCQVLFYESNLKWKMKPGARVLQCVSVLRHDQWCLYPKTWTCVELPYGLHRFNFSVKICFLNLDTLFLMWRFLRISGSCMAGTI